MDVFSKLTILSALTRLGQEPAPPVEGGITSAPPAVSSEGEATAGSPSTVATDSGEATTTSAPRGPQPAESATAEVPSAAPSTSDAPAPAPDGAEAAAAQPEAAAERKWHDDISFGAFVDAYAGVNYNFPNPQAGTNFGRAFDRDNGFSLAWAGLDAVYDREKASATIGLRFGSGPNYGWTDDAVPGAQFVKQAFLTWKITPRWSIDAGRFDTIFGAEVAESWLNHNYTRGFLYNLAQPFWHTGLRSTIKLHDLVALKLMLVNGWGLIVDNNKGKSAAAQLGFTSRNGVVGLYAGYMTGPENPDVDPGTGDAIRRANWQFRHLADVVLTMNWEKVSLAFNADYIYDGVPGSLGADQQWYGGMASGFFRVVDWFGVGMRGELLGDPDGFLSGSAGAYLGSGTLTLDFRPADYIVIRLDGRYDGSNDALFPRSTRETSQHQVTTTLGLVVKSF